jgi:putative oxidoreductase
MLAAQLADPKAVDLALLVLRLTCGLMIMAHGYNHIFGGGKIQGTAGWFASMGMKPGILHAWLASVTELGAGLLLIAGLLTPLAAAGLLSVMIVAWITAHRKNGFFIFKPGQGWEYVMFISFTALALGTIGAGEWSLDHALDITAFDGWTGFLITALAGYGGALALLVVFWRPGKD